MTPGGVPRAVLRYSPRVAKPSFQNVRLNAASETLSPNHWCMFSWLNVVSEGPIDGGGGTVWYVVPTGAV